MLCCPQIKKGKIFYGIEVFTDKDDFVPTLEIYEFLGFNNDEVVYNVILGDYGLIRFPQHFDLNQIFYEFYNDTCVWAYSFNELLMVDLLDKLIKGETITISEVYNIWEDRWKTVPITISIINHD